MLLSFGRLQEHVSDVFGYVIHFFSGASRCLELGAAFLVGAGVVVCSADSKHLQSLEILEFRARFFLAFLEVSFSLLLGVKKVDGPV